MNISKTLSSKINLIPDCTAQLLDQIKALSFTQEDIFKIKLCLDEALSNAIVHGNRLNSQLPVEVSLRAKENGVEIDIINQGEGFDFQTLEDPRVEKNTGKVHGRGLFLIKNNMDKVDFFDHGRKMTMTKFFKR